MRAAPLLLLGLLGCQPSAPEDAGNPSASERPLLGAGRSPAEPWGARLEDPKNPTPALLWNGIVGVRIGRLATGYDAEDNALPSFHIGEVQRDGEEKILPVSNPLGIVYTVDGKEPGTPSRYVQRLDFRTGRLDTEWEQGGVSFRVETALHPQAPILAQKWTVRGSGLLRMRSGFASALPWTGSELDARSELSPGGRPVGLRHRSSRGTWAPVRGGFEWTCRLNGEASTLYRVATWDQAASGLMVDDVFAASERVWAERWKTDIQIEGPIEDQQAVRSFLFYLRSAIAPEGGRSVAPFGLADATYFGHVFWDADLWVMPSLMLLDPPLAQEIARYRVRMEPAARSEFDAWSDSLPSGGGRAGVGGTKVGGAGSLPHGGAGPEARREIPPPLRGRGRGGGSPTATASMDPDQGGVKYPWESSVTGRETVPGPSRFQHHISATVVFALEKAAALGLVPKDDVDRIGRGVAQFLELRTVAGPKGREFKDTMSPDEHHTGDNDLYTNLLAEHVLRKYSKTFAGPSPLEGGKPGLMKLPRDEKGFLAYDNDGLRGYKQAAAELAVYPLQFPPAIAEAGLILERIAPKVTPNGPAMTDSIHAILEARHGDVEKAYEEWRRSWHDFTEAPFLLFSEKRRKVVTYFTTGAAGSLQAVLFGFGGIHLGKSPPADAAWKLPLKNGSWLYGTKGRLPSGWKSVTIRGLQVLGKRYDLRVDADGSRLTTER